MRSTDFKMPLIILRQEARKTLLLRLFFALK